MSLRTINFHIHRKESSWSPAKLITEEKNSHVPALHKVAIELAWELVRLWREIYSVWKMCQGSLSLWPQWNMLGFLAMNFVTSRMSKFFFSMLKRESSVIRTFGPPQWISSHKTMSAHISQLRVDFAKFLIASEKFRHIHVWIHSVFSSVRRPDALRNFTIMRRINFGHKKVIKIRRFVCKVEFDRFFLRSTLLNFRTHRIWFFFRQFFFFLKFFDLARWNPVHFPAHSCPA